MTHQLPSENALSSAIKRWALIDEAGIDLSFMDRQHRRRLSTTSRLALTAYHRCNQDLVAYRTVFASRYGEYSRTFGILTDLAAGEPASPAAFSVSVHNVPAGVLGIATHNTAASNTVAAGAASLEAGFVDAATQLIETCEDVILVFVDEPLPALYARFQRRTERAYALALHLTRDVGPCLGLSWLRASTGGRGPDGVPGSGERLAELLDSGAAQFHSSDGRLTWRWTFDES
jgi:hypothetical protein